MNDKVFGNIQVVRRDNVRDELLRQYYEKNVEVDNTIGDPNANKPIPPPIAAGQNPYENNIVESFRSSMEVYRNGQKVSNNDYYRDFQERQIDNVQSQGGFYQSKPKVQPTNEPVDQVDPASFFGSSLKGII